MDNTPTIDIELFQGLGDALYMRGSEFNGITWSHSVRQLTLPSGLVYCTRCDVPNCDDSTRCVCCAEFLS